MCYSCMCTVCSGCYAHFSLLSFAFMYSSDGKTVVKRVKDYACQYATAKSLPFSASEMTMDVVAAAFSTVAPEEPKVKAIRLLRAKGYNAESNMLFHEIYTQYMYHVVFSDNDKQDYWRHELEVIKYRCDEEDSEGADSGTDRQDDL